MRLTIARSLVSLAVILVALPAFAADAPPPVVLLMWDGSGSMLLTQDGNVVDSEVKCLATPPRLHIAQQIFTGSIAAPTCTKTARTGGGIGPYWSDYALDYWKLTGTRAPDGMIDKYKDVVKFAFMTTDPETCTNNNNNCGFSYGHGFNGVNLGARGPDAGEELSGLLTVATTDAQTDINTNNSNVEKRIENLIPYGSTPIAAFFEDALHYFKNDPQVKPYSGGVGDQFYDCRLKRIIFITDGVETNILGTNRTATEVITELFNLGIETYVIGYALSTAEKDVSLLTEMARAGRGRDDVDFYNAADGDALRKALAEIMVDIQGSLRTFGTPLVTNRTGNLKDLQFECYYGDRKNLISAIDRSGEIQCIAYRCTCPPPTGEPDDGTVQPCETYSLTDNYRDKMLSGWNPTTYTPIQHRGTRGRSTLATGNGIPNDMAPLSDTNLTVLLWGEEYMTRLLNLVPTTITNTTNNLLGITTTDPCKDTTTWVDGGTVTDSTSKTGDESTTAPSLSWTTVKPQTNTVEYFDWSRCAANKKALWAEIVATSTSRRWPDGYGPVTHAEIIEPPVADINNASFELFKEQRKNDPTMLYALTADGKVMAHKLSWEGGQSQDFGPVIWSYVPGCLQPYLRQWQGGGDINLMGGKFQVRHVRYKVSLSTLTATSGVNKASEEWRTVMVGCTGAVSQCCFGLDITDPNNFFVRWETRPGRRCFLKEKGTEGSQLDDEWVCYESPIDWDNDSADVVARKFGEFGSMSVQPEIGNIFRVVKGESFTEAVTVIPTGYALTRQKDGVDYRLGGRAIYVLRLSDGAPLKVVRSYFDSPTSTTRVAFDADMTGTPAGYNTFTDTLMSRIFFGDAKGRVFRLGVASFDPTKVDGTDADSVDNWTARLMFDAFNDPNDSTFRYDLTAVERRPINYAPALTIKGRGLLTVIGGTGNLATEGYFPYKNVVFSFNEKLVPGSDGTATLATEENWRYRLRTGEMLTYTPIVFGGIAYWTTYLPNSGLTACDIGTGYLYGVNYTLADSNGLPYGLLDDASVGSDNRWRELPNTRPNGPKVVQRPTCFDDVDYDNALQQGKYSGVQLSNARAGKTQIVVSKSTTSNTGTTGVKYGGKDNKKMFTMNKDTVDGRKPKNKLIIQTGWSLLIL